MDKMNNTALKSAVSLLVKRDYSIAELTTKLQQKGYCIEEIKEVIVILTQRGYLKEQELCQRRFQQYYQTHKYSANYVAKKLMSQGFDENDVLNSMDNVDLATEVEIARKLLEKKDFMINKCEKEDLVKFLLNKGFSHQTIENILL